MKIAKLVLALVAYAFAAQVRAQDMSIAIGTSVPADPSGLTHIMQAGPSRANNGEHFLIKFNGPKMINEIKITSYSAGHAGKALIRSAKGLTGATTVNIDGLFKFSSVTSGNPVNYQNLVMLPDTTWVAVAPNQPYSQLDIQVEGFTNNDASILIQITSPDGLTLPEFLVTRTSNNETLGHMIDESRYARFSESELSRLMSVGTQPTADELNGKTFSCSVYTKLNSAKVDVKRRGYVLSGSELYSNSDLQGPRIPWSVGPEGLQMPVDNYTGCGRFATANVVRKTGSGNLIAEVILDLDKWVAQCQSMGFDPDGIKSVEENSTFPSVIDPKYRVDAYEFCRLVNN
ncbi:MAG: hypothetical protein AB7F86_04250 [Bdellovibrionales bacterium]